MKKSLTISLTLMAIFVAFLFFNIVTLKAQQSTLGFYDNPDMGLEAVMVSYHQYVNDTVNNYTKKMLTKLEKNPNDPNGKAPENPEACLKSQNNFSTFCLASTLLGDLSQPDNRGYLNYKKAINERRNKIFDDTMEQDAWNSYIDAVTIGEKNTKKTEGIYQTEKALIISARIEAIDREIKSSKEALDKTLATYDQLRIAWPMHKEYVKIFKELTIYRDSLVELRHQTDTFPKKFLDVTSSKCV